ncbi:MAG: FAD-binding protein [Oscillospiraceae bacterium]|nr:FAD-binding protein [Oscillospiraceae bacterium]
MFGGVALFDCIIIGLGPAGATLARLLAENSASPLKIAAVDKKHVPSGDTPHQFDKPCGGLLAPDAQKALAKFDLTLPGELLVSPQIFSVRTIDLDCGKTRYYQRFYLNLSRRMFDEWLISLIPQSVSLFRGCSCSSITRTNDGFAVTVADSDDPNAEKQTLYAKYIIGADGANSIVRRTFFPKFNPRSYVSIQQWFAAEKLTFEPGIPAAQKTASPFYSCIFDSENTDCYSWSISKDGYLIFGGAYPAKDCRKRFEAQKQKLKAYGFDLDTPVYTEACQVLRPASPAHFQTGRDGVFLIGEAAGFVSPSSLEGISSALESARLLARILTCGAQKTPSRLAGEYRRATAKLRCKLLFKLLKCPFMYSPLLRRLVMASGLEALKLE